MVLVYAKNADQKYNPNSDDPRKQASRQSYGRRRVIFDKIDFADTPVAANDYIVLYDSTEAQSLYDFNFGVGNQVSDLATGTLGYYDPTDDNFVPITGAITLPVAAGAQVPATGLTDADWVDNWGQGAWANQDRTHRIYLVLRADAAGTAGQLIFQGELAVD